jgi:hypothetical protein
VASAFFLSDPVGYLRLFNSLYLGSYMYVF